MKINKFKLIKDITLFPIIILGFVGMIIIIPLGIIGHFVLSKNFEEFKKEFIFKSMLKEMFDSVNFMER
jgi:ABC-type antimicrobial peptide transport system permease subunit